MIEISENFLNNAMCNAFHYMFVMLVSVIDVLHTVRFTVNQSLSFSMAAKQKWDRESWQWVYGSPPENIIDMHINTAYGVLRPSCARDKSKHRFVMCSTPVSGLSQHS